MSNATIPDPETTDDAPRYLRASIPVVSGHLKHKVSVSRARDEIRYAALRLSAHLAGPTVKSLAAKLEHATGCTIEQLAAEAERWPASAKLGPVDDCKVTRIGAEPKTIDGGRRG